MMRRKGRARLFVAVSIVLIMLLSAAALADVRTTGNVYLRTGPGKEYSTITAIPPGRSLKYLGETSVDYRGVAWYKVEHNGRACWISSRYSVLTEQPVQKPTPTPQPKLQLQPQSSPTPAGGGSLNWNNSGAGTQSRAAMDVSVYYLQGLSETAQALGLSNYMEVMSEAPHQYYNEALTIGGENRVEYLEIHGSGYSFFGAEIGMRIEDAKRALETAGLRCISDDADMCAYEHPSSTASTYDSNGYDSNILLDVRYGTVIEMSWSSYTG